MLNRTLPPDEFDKLLQMTINQIGTNPIIIKEILTSKTLSKEKIKKICISALKINPEAFQYIPLNMLDLEICTMANKQYYKALQWTPYWFKDSELCQAAISNDYRAIQWVPFYLDDHENLCLIAVKQNILALLLIKEDYIRRALIIRLLPETLLEIINHSSTLSEQDIKKLLLVIVEAMPGSIGLIREDILDDEICLSAVSRFGCLLKDLPDSKKNKSICIAAILENPSAYFAVPKQILDEEIILTAVSVDGKLLSSIDPVALNEKIYLAAVINNPRVLYLVPDEFKIEGFYQTAAKQNYKILHYIPDQYKTADLFSATVANDYRAIELVPEANVVAYLNACIVAVKQHPLALTLIKNEAIRQEIIENLAKDIFSELFKYNLSANENNTICIIIIKAFPNAIDFVPTNLFNKKLCLDLINIDIKYFQYIPEHIADEELYLVAVSKNGQLLEWFVPEANRTKNICLAAVSNTASAILGIPSNILDEEIILKVVSKDGSFIKLIEEDKINQNICFAAVLNNPIALHWVPLKFKTESLCSIAVSKNYYTLTMIPEELQTKKICLAAVQKNFLALELIKNKHIMVETLEEITPQRLIAMLNKNEKELSAEKIKSLCLLLVKSISISPKVFPENLLDDEICTELLKTNGLFLGDIPTKKINKQMCMTAIASNSDAYFYVPHPLLDKEIIRCAVSKSKSILSHIPAKLLNEEICIAAATHDYKALQLIPDEYKTEKLFLAAVRQNPLALQYVPNDDLKLKIINIVTQKDLLAKDYHALTYFPKSILDRQSYLQAVISNYKAIELIPAQYRTEKIYVAAVSTNYMALSLVPAIDQNEQMCRNAIQHNVLAFSLIKDDLFRAKFINEFGFEQLISRITSTQDLSTQQIKQLFLSIIQSIPEAIKSIPQNYLDEELYVASMLRNGSLLSEIPISKRTKKICLTAVSNHPKAYYSVPKNILDEEICIAIISQDPKILRDLPLSKRNKRICLTAISKDSQAYFYVPESIIDEDIIHELVKNDGSKLKYTPKNLLNEKLCITAIKNDWQALTWVPYEHKSENVFLAAIENNYLALEIIPKELQTEKVCLTAVQQNHIALKLIREDNVKTEVINQITPEVLLSKDYRLLQYFPNNLLTLEICCMAVRENPLALSYIKDEQLKLAVIKKITPVAILSNNYASLQYFPKDEECKLQTSTFLSNIKHVIVVEKHFLQLNEVKDSYLTYADAETRKGLTITVDCENLKDLLNNLEINNAKNVNLVLLGHGNQKIIELAGQSIYNIENLLKNYSYISKITPFACYTVTSKKLDEEVQMIQSFSDEVNLDHGFATVSLDKALDNALISKILDSLKTTSAYLLIKNSKNEYQLAYVSNTLQANINYYSLTKEQLFELKNIFNKGRPFKFPSTKVATCYNSIITNESKLTPKQLTVIENIRQGNLYEKLKKGHPEYKNQREIFPFLKNFKIDIKEANTKLSNSFVKRIFDHLISHPESYENNEKLSIKGYTRILNINTDPQNRGFIISESGIYTKEYQSSFSESFFNKNKSNIDNNNLNQDRKDSITFMTKNKQNGKTMAKSIEVEIKKAKK